MAGVLERSEKRAFLDDTTPLIANIVTNRVVPKQNYVVSIMFYYQVASQPELLAYFT